MTSSASFLSGLFCAPDQIVNLAIFDLDHTLIAADCSELWAMEMQNRGWINSADFWQQHRRLMQEYAQGDLCMEDYLQLNLSPLVGKDLALVAEAARSFAAERLISLIYPTAYQLVQQHREQGHLLLMISASEDFLVQPLAEHLGFDAAIGIGIETRQGCITGRPLQPLSYQAGKIACLQHWLSQHSIQPGQSWFYSDSHNDLPLLDWVDHPRPVNANTLLQQLAASRGWSWSNLVG